MRVVYWETVVVTVVMTGAGLTVAVMKTGEGLAVAVATTVLVLVLVGDVAAKETGGGDDAGRVFREHVRDG